MRFRRVFELFCAGKMSGMRVCVCVCVRVVWFESRIIQYVRAHATTGHMTSPQKGGCGTKEPNRALVGVRECAHVTCVMESPRFCIVKTQLSMFREWRAVVVVVVRAIPVFFTFVCRCLDMSNAAKWKNTPGFV